MEVPLSVAVGLYVLCSGSMLVLNKLTLNALPQPLTVLAAQLGVTAAVFAAPRVLQRVSGAPPPHQPLYPSTPDLVRSFSIMATIFLGVIYSNMRMLQHSGVNLFVVVKSSTPLLISVIDWALLGRQLPQGRSLASLGGIAAFGGMYGAARFEAGDLSDDQASLLFWTVAWIAVFSADCIWGKQVASKGDATPTDATLYTNAYATAFLAVLWSGSRALSDSPPPTSGASAAWIALVLAGSSLVGTGMSFAGFAVRKDVSATSFSVLGVGCKMLSLLLNEFVLSEEKGDLSRLILVAGAVTSSAFYRPAPLRSDAESPMPSYAPPPAGAAKTAVREKQELDRGSVWRVVAAVVLLFAVDGLQAPGPDAIGARYGPEFGMLAQAHGQPRAAPRVSAAASAVPAAGALAPAAPSAAAAPPAPAPAAHRAVVPVASAAPPPTSRPAARQLPTPKCTPGSGGEFVGRQSTGSGLGDRLSDFVGMWSLAWAQCATPAVPWETVLPHKYPAFGKLFDVPEGVRVTSRGGKKGFSLHSKPHVTKPPILRAGKAHPRRMWDLHAKALKLEDLVTLDELRAAYQHFASRVKPAKYIADELARVAPILRGAVGLHMRRGDKVVAKVKDPLDMSYKQVEELDKTTEQVVREVLQRTPGARFFVATDSAKAQAHYRDVIEKAGGHAYFHKHRKLTSGEHESYEDIPSAVLEMYMLSSCSVILQSSVISSFSWFAAVHGNVPLVNTMRSNKYLFKGWKGDPTPQTDYIGDLVFPFEERASVLDGVPLATGPFPQLPPPPPH